MKRMNLPAAVLALLVFHILTFAQTVPLNTGYNHLVPVLSPLPPVGVSSIPDNYWINIASSFPPATPTTTFVLNPGSTPWLPLPNANWISARNTVGSASGTSNINPSYTIFKKCYCLLPGYQNVAVRFLARADNNITVWFNDTLHPLLPASSGHWSSGAPLMSLPTNPSYFHTGRNCIYVLLEDDGGLMGFTMDGNITATWGLLPRPAMGTGQTFEPCTCNTGPTGVASGNPRALARKEDGGDEQAVVNAIVTIAEARRRERKN
jgi:hypothetical protein